MINEGEKTFVLRQIGYAKDWLDKALGHYEKADDGQGFMDLTIAEAEIRNARERSARMEAQKPKPNFARQRVRIAQVSVASIMVFGFVAGIVYSQVRNITPNRMKETGISVVNEVKPDVQTQPAEIPKPMENPQVVPTETTPAPPMAENITAPEEPQPVAVPQPEARSRPHSASAGARAVSSHPAVIPAPAAVKPPQPEPKAVEIIVAPAATQPAGVSTQSSYEASILSLEEYSALREAALKARDNVK